MEFAVGQLVQARGLDWQILELERLGAQRRLHLRCTTGDLRGLEWDVLHPFEPVHPATATLHPDQPVPPQRWRLHHLAALLDQVFGPATPVAARPGRLHPEPYQLVPLMRALELPRPRLLLADDVGLGKTVQAGLVVTELIARRQAHRVLVVAPAGPLLRQWQQELRQRFGLHFTVIADSAALAAQRRGMELGGNPFSHTALVLTALDFAKQERVLQELERAAWDIAILDEAHHCIAAGTDQEATQRRRLAEVVARRSDALLLLTATPHDGYDPHFSSLIELLDPSLVDGHGAPIGLAYRRHVVRRLKSQLRDPAGAALFAERRVVPVRVALEGAALAPVRAFHRALAALVTPRLQGRSGTEALALVGLLKRSVSTIGACVATLQVVAERYRALADDPAQAAALRRERARALRAWHRRSRRYGTLDAVEEGDAEQLEIEHIAADLHAPEAPAGMAQALQQVIALGQAAAAADPKLAALLQEVRLIRTAEPAANILVYTEYADSQRVAAAALRQAGLAGAVLTISGQDSEDDRIRATERCAQQDAIVLVSTDSLAEGLNLQQRCRHLIHLDLPYNPNRLEQRNGRIDRYGQRRTPEIRYLYLAGTFEERLLLRLIAKYEQARARLADMPTTLGVTADTAALATALVRGFAEQPPTLFPQPSSAIRTLDQAAEQASADTYRDLLHEIDRAFALYDRDAVRHGWFADQGAQAGAASLAAAEATQRQSEQQLGWIDLPGFVAAVVADATRTPAAEAEVIPLPADWTHGLQDLPGYDPAARCFRFTRDPGQLFDAASDSLGFLGRAHPLLRRAISQARGGGGAVSVVHAPAGQPGAALLTWEVELCSPRHVALRRVIAVQVPQDGPATLLPDPALWLQLADRPEHFGGVPGWLSRRQAEADALIHAEAARLAASCHASLQDAAHAERDGLQRWLASRAAALCGEAEPGTPDLFGVAPTGPAWRFAAPALERLAALALDPDLPPARRREAQSVVTLFQRRETERTDRITLAPPTIRPLGLLLVLPCDQGDGSGPALPPCRAGTGRAADQRQRKERAR